MTTQSFKPLNSKDVVTTRELLHESIPITGSLLSGTYGNTATSTEFPNEPNIKNFSHGMFQSIYDYPYLSSSANHIFDITVGYSTSSSWAHSDEPIPNGDNTQNTAKLNIYNQMAQGLVGHDHTGSIKTFQIPGGDLIREAYFVNFSRLLVKDEIKKGSFSIEFGTGSTFVTAHDYAGSTRKLVDYGATTYYTDSPAGDYAVLTMSANPPEWEQGGKPAGLIYYQAGIAVLSASMFWPLDASHIEKNADHDADDYIAISGSGVGLTKDDDNLTFKNLLVSSSISGTANALRRRIDNLEFQNTTELNSTVHFCRLNHGEFNYSSNPTYLSESKIQVKGNDKSALPISYVTTIGLYGPDNALLAVAKLSRPLKKTSTNEITLRVRLDY